MATIQNNVITAGVSGRVEIAATLRQSGRFNGDRWHVLVAHIHVINETTMTPVTTAQELADMNNNLKGHFILGANIDLYDFGEWLPIGRSIAHWEREGL